MNEIPGVRLAERAVIVCMFAASAAALALSYRGLYDFATQHGGYPRWAAIIFPVIVDIFLVGGELRLFIATAKRPLLRGWEGFRVKTWAWLLTFVGLAASMAGNVAHTGLGSPWPMKLAAAAPPLAAAASLFTGLGLIKLKAREAKTPADRDRQPGDVVSLSAVGGSASRPRQPAGQARARSPLSPALVAAIQADAANGLGRKRLAGKHGVSEHHVRTALAAPAPAQAVS